MSNKKEPELSVNETEALRLLRSNIRERLAKEMGESEYVSSGPNLTAIQEAVFEQFKGKEKIAPNKHRPLLIKALKEVVAKL